MDFEVRRADLQKCRFIDEPPAHLELGQALLRVEAFALTANNVTYGLFGDAMQYWQFFPSREPDEWGRIPVWGFAEVLASEHDRVAEGTRVYGYLPMSTHLVVMPAEVSEPAFVDVAPHRAALPAIYNRYERADADPLHEPEHEDQRMLLWPLFFTAFLIDDFFDDNGFFGAEAVVLSSASSKTAIGTAFQVSQRQGVDVIGLTSPARLAFVEALGIYDRVVGYDDVAALPGKATAYVDIAGNAVVRAAVHHHYGDRLVHSMAVGVTHWDQPFGDSENLPGPRPAFFFAPAQISKRAADWGPGGLNDRIGPAWRAYVDFCHGWMRVEHGWGPEAVERLYRDLLEGRTDPAMGHVLSLSPHR